MKITVRIDENVCIGSGSCVVMAQEYFALAADGKAIVKDSQSGKKQGRELILEVNETQKEHIVQAAQACPVIAISIVDEKGRKLYPQ